MNVEDLSENLIDVIQAMPISMEESLLSLNLIHSGIESLQYIGLLLVEKLMKILKEEDMKKFMSHKIDKAITTMASDVKSEKLLLKIVELLSITRDNEFIKFKKVGILNKEIIESLVSKASLVEPNSEYRNAINWMVFSILYLNGDEYHNIF